MSQSPAPPAPVREPLPPGQVWGKKFVIYAAMGVQNVDPAKWRLKVTGLVKVPLVFGYQEFLSLPMKSYSKSFFCLAPGSVVFAKPKPIAIEQVRPGMEIVGNDGLNHRVTELVRLAHDGSMFGIKASYLPPVVVTPDHPIWTVRGHRGYGEARSKRRKLTFREGWTAGWVSANEVRKGDYVLFPKYRFVSQAREVVTQGLTFLINEKLARLIGWYLAEGSAASSGDRMVGFALNSSETEHMLEIIELMEDLMGARMATYFNHRGTGMTVVATSSKAGYLRRIFAEWCGAGAANKYIPDFLLDAQPDVLREFLVRYMRGDGYTAPAAARITPGLIDFTTSSRILSYQLLLALSKLDIPGELVNHPGSVRMGYSVRVRGEKIRNLIPEFKVPERVNRFHYKETPEGFYYPIQKVWSVEYEGPVFDLRAPPTYTMLSPFVTQDCVTRWSIDKPLWEGVPIRYLADAAQVKPEAQWVMFHCTDGYTAPIPVEDALMDDSIVALKLNGKPLSAEQGFPARPFMPHLYGWKSAKWLDEIEFIPEYKDGYWEGYGYHERGDVYEEERFKQGGDHKPKARQAFGTA